MHLSCAGAFIMTRRTSCKNGEYRFRVSFTHTVRKHSLCLTRGRYRAKYVSSPVSGPSTRRHVICNTAAVPKHVPGFLLAGMVFHCFSGRCISKRLCHRKSYGRPASS